MIFYYLDLKWKPSYHSDITSWQNQNYCFTRTHLYRQTNRQFCIPMKHATQSRDIKPTPASVNGDVIGSQSSSRVTSSTPCTCTWIISFPIPEDDACKPSSPLSKSMQFFKSTTVMTVVLTHYMIQNTIRTISCSIRTDNSCCVQIYCIATYRITDTKESPKQRNFLLQNIMAKVHTMFRDPIMSQTNPVHTRTWFNGKYEI